MYSKFGLSAQNLGLTFYQILPKEYPHKNFA